MSASGYPSRDAPGGGTGRLLAGMVGAVLLLGLWVGGSDTSVGTGGSPAMTGDVAAVGRPPAHPLPRPHAPLPSARPRRVVVESAGVHAPVVSSAPGRAGAVSSRTSGAEATAGWFCAGLEPGAPGAAVLVGRPDAARAAAVFRALSGVRPGETVTVSRSDGTVAEFTVENVEVADDKRFDVRRAYAARSGDRAELRLIARGGRYDRGTHAYSAQVVVFAYLTGHAGGAAGAGS